jgi:D-arabinose 1-dehydrogenase-like Zn-dependent alcohol dehydrogenase
VIAAGPGAKGKVSVGDHVAVYPWGGCQRCQECTVGDQNLCSQKHANDIGNGKNMFGGFSSHVVIPTYKYCFDKSGIPDGLAAIYMCSGLTAYAALKKIGSPANGARDVLILGLGGVGMQGFEMAKVCIGNGCMLSRGECVGVKGEVTGGSHVASIAKY